jgi:hypothetical protein
MSFTFGLWAAVPKGRTIKIGELTAKDNQQEVIAPPRCARSRCLSLSNLCRRNATQ